MSRPIHITIDPAEILPGSVSTARAKCGQPNCRCQKNPKFMHGPYYRWTGKISGKATARTLTPKEAAECKKRIKNYRKIQEKIDKAIEKALELSPWKQDPKK